MTKRGKKHPPLVFFYSSSSFPLFLFLEVTHTHEIITQGFFFFYYRETCASEFVTAVTGHILRVKDAKQPFFLLLLSIRLVGSGSSPGNLLILLSRPLYLLSVFFLSSSSLFFLSFFLSFFFFQKNKRGIFFEGKRTI